MIPAQRVPAEEPPGRQDRREDPGNGSAPSPSTAWQALWAHLGPAEAPTEPFPAVRPARSSPATEETRTAAAPVRPALPPMRARRGRGFTAAAVITLVLLLGGSLVVLLKRHAGTPSAVAPTTTSAQAVEARAAAAAWVASQVGRAAPISCDQQMCQELQAHGDPAAHLMVLRPGAGNPLHSRVIVVTPAVIKMVGTEFLTANAPAAIASFGSGSTQVSVRVIYPQGAAAYAAALRNDIAERKTGEATLLQNPRITAQPAARQQLEGGQVDTRLLLTLAQLASQWPLSIVAFGDRAPGASPGIPLRSADLSVTGNATSQARQMAAFVHGLGGYFADARIKVVRLADGQDAVRIEFAAPGPFGLLNR
jgi:hypothetical protein